MDTLAHGLWAGAAFIAAKRKLGAALRLHWALLWGVFPDLFAFSVPFLMLAWYRLFGGASSPRGLFSTALREAIPPFLQPHVLYQWSHSLVIFAALYALVWVARRRPALAMLAWPLHILMDIPSHRAGRYGTPFLWPLSSYRFDGVSWGQRWFMILNYSAITAAFAALLIWFLVSERRRRRPQPLRPSPERK